jgi:succinate dehydrogenase / fumarate reductase membrane anchor subunit
MTMRTPLAKVRGLGSARSGTGHFWHQRITAVFGVPLMIYLVIFVLAHLGSDRSALVASVQNPFNAVLLSLALFVNLWHMKLGMQVIIEDYVHGPLIKLVLLLLNLLFPAVLAVAGLLAILKMSFAS